MPSPLASFCDFVRITVQSECLLTAFPHLSVRLSVSLFTREICKPWARNFRGIREMDHSKQCVKVVPSLHSEKLIQ